MIIAILRPLATALTIGSGGSVGIEGPAVQFGAVIGATLWHFLHISNKYRIHLIGCGVAAGIAAIFNAPLGGWFFAMEVIATDWRPLTMLLTLIATLSATWITEFILGNFHLLQHVSLVFSYGWFTILAALILGSTSGLVALLFINWTTWCKQMCAKLIKNNYIRHMSGMLLVGIMLYYTFLLSGHYFVTGGSYSGMSDILSGNLHFIWFLAIIIIIKWLVTSLTIETGGSGGIFSPVLFMGAALGAVIAYILNTILGWHVSIAFFAFCGMAGMLGATSGALISAPVMIVELTTNYHILLATIVSSISAFAVRRFFLKQSIYTHSLYKYKLIIPENYYVAQMKCSKLNQNNN